MTAPGWIVAIELKSGGAFFSHTSSPIVLGDVFKVAMREVAGGILVLNANVRQRDFAVDHLEVLFFSDFSEPFLLLVLG